MLFVEPSFLLVFLPLFVAAFYLVGRFAGKTVCLGVIVLASCIFYAPYGVVPAALLLTSLATNLTAAISLTRIGDERPRTRNAILAAGLGFNFVLLGLFKYANDLALLAGAADPVWKYAIPAGISFYTFHQAVFLVDVHGRRPEVVAFLGQTQTLLGRVGAFVRYGAFVAFFPQLVIGPIVYLSEFAPQAARRTFGRFSVMNLQVGASLIVFGLFKKLCIADPISRVCDPIYKAATDGDPISAAQAAFALPGFFFQLYFDFSGYSDIALGIGRVFGITLPLNFDSPLKATGIVDFYRRWHITLTRVIARFLFTPLSVMGTRFALDKGLKGWRRRSLTSWLPLLVNFQVIALWHGAKETFLVFGAVHALWFVFETEWRSSKRAKAIQAKLGTHLSTFLAQVLTVTPLMLTFALFRSESVAGFLRLTGSLDNLGVKGKYETELDWMLLAAAALVIYLLPNCYELMRRYRPGLVTFDNRSLTPGPLRRVRWRPNLVWGVVLAVLLALVALKLNVPAPFLYGGF